MGDVLPGPDAMEHLEVEVIPVPKAEEQKASPQLPDEAVEIENLRRVEEIKDVSVGDSVTDPQALEDKDLAASTDATPGMPPAIAETEAEEPKQVIAEAPTKKEIIEADGVFSYGTMTFSSRAAAERYVSQFGVNSDAKLSDAANDSSFEVAVGSDAFKTEIVCRDGHFVVGGKAFKNKGPAVEYQRELQAKASVT